MAELSAPEQLAVELTLAGPNADETPSGRLAIVLGKGGAAGPVSLGALDALDELGYLEVARGLGGGSIGLINAVAKHAGQSDVALEGYHEMVDGGFINLWRLLRVFDMRLLRRRLNSALNVEKVTKDSTLQLFGGYTQVSAGFKPKIFNFAQVEPEDVVDIIIGGATMGALAGVIAPKEKGRRNIIGRRKAIADIGFSHYNEVDDAIDADFDTIIYLPNQRYAEDKYDKKQATLMAAGLMAYDPLAIPHYRGIVHKQVDSKADFCDGEFMRRGAHVLALYPPDEEDLPTLLNMDNRKIDIGYQIGRQNVLDRVIDLRPIRELAAARMQADRSEVYGSAVA